MSTESYKGYLGSQYWEQVKSKIKLRDNFACQISGKRTHIEVHHIAYKVRIDGELINIVGRELEFLDWLILLTKEEHKRIHENTGHALNPYNPCKINAIEFKKRNYL